MKVLQERLNTVQELLTHAEFIRTHADTAASLEAGEQEMLLKARKSELEKQIAAEKPPEKPKMPRKRKLEPALAHAE